jgi:hypothetical protein
MRTNIFTACGALAVAGLTVSAQTPQTPPSQPPTPATSQRPMDAGSPVTVTGCLAAWDGKSMSSSGSDAGSAASSSARASDATAKYMLTNVQHGTGSPSTTSGATSAGGAGSSYMLKADSTVKLSAHLNHKVSVTGTLDKLSAPSGSESARTPSPTDPSAIDKPAAASGSARAHDTGSMKLQTLKVTSVTMVSATCP